jgi:transposase
VRDNAKTGVTKACRYDPDLNPTYQEMAMHHGVGVVPRVVAPQNTGITESWSTSSATDRCNRLTETISRNSFLI